MPSKKPNKKRKQRRNLAALHFLSSMETPHDLELQLIVSYTLNPSDFDGRKLFQTEPFTLGYREYGNILTYLPVFEHIMANRTALRPISRRNLQSRTHILLHLMVG